MNLSLQIVSLKKLVLITGVILGSAFVSHPTLAQTSVQSDAGSAVNPVNSTGLNNNLNNYDVSRIWNNAYSYTAGPTGFGQLGGDPPPDSASFGVLTPNLGVPGLYDNLAYGTGRFGPDPDNAYSTGLIEPYGAR